jgi:hypothetical protein
MANNVTLPKRTTIGGMPHKLAYITPQEGDLLKRMGGSGQMHRGVPAYPPQGMVSAMGGSATGAGDGGATGTGGDGRGLAADIAANQAVQNAIAAIAQAEAESGTTSQNVQAANFAKKFGINIAPNEVVNVVTDDAGNIVNVTHNATGIMGKIADMFGVTATVNTGYNTGINAQAGSQYGRGDIPSQRVVPAVVDAAGEKRCPTGYYFNETLQACIMDTRSTSPFQPSGSMGVAEMSPPTGYYARMGLLDEPPSGLLEAGFGSPQDFAAANTAFRRGAATRPSMYTDPYNLQGYTLLS